MIISYCGVHKKCANFLPNVLKYMFYLHGETYNKVVTVARSSAALAKSIDSFAIVVINLVFFF